MKGNYLLKGLAVVFFLLMLSVVNVMAQIDYCEGDFDADGDQDGTDAFTFKTDFGRSSISNPCPPGVSCGGILKTGQTQCWDENGLPISCAGTGQDGEYQIGYSRFTDNGDGTVTDNSTGLIWLKDANCSNINAPITWWDALNMVIPQLHDGHCGLLDGSNEGDWRLPNIRELKSLYDSINFDDGMPMEPHPFVNVETHYWSSTTSASFTGDAWLVGIYDGWLNFIPKPNTFWVWPVRGGR